MLQWINSTWNFILELDVYVVYRVFRMIIDNKKL